MIDGINHITLAVDDIGAAFRFYRDILGLKPVMKSAISAYFLAGPVWLALVKEAPRPDREPGYGHVAFNLPATELGGLARRLADAGCTAWQENRTEGDSFYFCDPAGNRLEIHASDLAARVASGKAEWGPDIEWFV
jgi:catechol 2,3-dioxygenase-like lactoylglutathione lyase family enzyme